MYQIREVFQAKAGKAKDLVKMFKQAAVHFEKTEGIKTQYQQSLQELENLYGSLSQMAFRGELKMNQQKEMA